MLIGRWGTSGDLVSLLWRRMAFFPPSDVSLMPIKVNSRLYQKSGTYSWCCKNLTSGLHYARMTKSFACVLQPVSRIGNVFKKTLQTWKWQRNIRDLLRRCSRLDNSLDFTEGLPEDASINSVSTMRILPFLTTLYGTQWDYFTCVMANYQDVWIW